jgi:O-antigen/teichoic acid export membrane protein
MSQTRHLVRGGALSGMSIFASMAALLVVGKLVTNALDQNAVAVFALLLLWSDFLNLAANFGLGVSLPKLIAAAEPPQARLFSGAALAFQTAVTGLVGGTIWIAWGFAPSPGARFGANFEMLYPWLWLIPPLFAVGMLRDTAMAALAGFNRYGQRAAGIVASAVMQVVLVYVFLWKLRGGVATLMLATTASYVVALLWLLLALPNGARWRFDPGAIYESIRFSGALYVNSLLTFLFQRFDTVLLTVFLKGTSAQITAAVAVYEMGKRVPMLVSRALGAVFVPFLPTIARRIADGDREGAARLLTRSSTLAIVAGYTTALGLVLIQEPLLTLLFNAQYLQATRVLGLLLAATAILVQTGLMGLSLIALGKPSTVTAINIVTAIITIALNALLLPRWGLTGAGLAALGGAVFTGLSQATLVFRSGLRFDVAAYIKPHAVMALAGGLCAWHAGSLLWRLAMLTLFIALCFMLRVLTPRELLEFARALLPGRLSERIPTRD